MTAPPKPVAIWLLTTVLAAETAFVAMQARLDFPFLAPALLGAVVIQIRTRSRRLELLGVLALACGLALLRFGRHWRLLWEHPAGFGLFLGLASLFFIGVAVLHSRPDELPKRIEAFAVALGIPVFVIITAAVLPGTGYAFPVTFDRVLYAFDGSLGFQPSFILGRLLGHLKWLGALASVSYEQVPAAMVILYASAMGVRERRKPNVLLLFGVASLAGYLLYALVPAAGPRFLFPSCFPTSPPPLAGVPMLPPPLGTDIPRNAMPSLHMTWAVLMFWNARRSGIWLRAGYGLYLFLTVLFTLGSGEHYLIDLVVALPFALAVQAGFSVPVRDLPRSLGFWVGLLGTFTWLGFLRYAVSLWSGSLLLDWSLVVVTVAGSVALEVQVYRRLRVWENNPLEAKCERFEAASAPL